MRKVDICHTLASLGGIASTARLRASGVTEEALQRAVATGAVIRPRRGVAALPGTPRPILRAAAAHGALACVSAAAFYGFWTPIDPRLHVSVRPNAALAASPRHHLHRDAHRLSESERFLVAPIRCVAQGIRHLPFDHAVALLDSARHAPASRWAEGAVDLPRLREMLPRRLHPVLDASDARAESGAESIARIRLQRAGAMVRAQWWVTAGVRVDLLVNDRLVVEIGSEAFHAFPEQYEIDHRRATTMLGLGFDVLEFTTRQVMDDWDSVESVILSRARPG